MVRVSGCAFVTWTVGGEGKYRIWLQLSEYSFQELQKW